MYNWVKLYTTNNYTEASIIKGMLEENNIPATILNRQASPYAGLGDDIEIYVAKEFAGIALDLVNKSLLN
jgi:hypothetical protein